MPAKTKVLGMLAPDRLYTREGVMRAIGIGYRTLKDLEKAGLPYREFGGGKRKGRCYYRGSDLIEAIWNGVEKS